MSLKDLTVKRPTWQPPNWVQGFVVLGSAAMVLALLGFGLQWTCSPLVVEIDGQPHEIFTRATTVGAALHHAGFDLYPEDLVSPSPEALLQAGMSVEVRRARPVTVVADGQAHQIRTHAKTVRELFQDAQIAIHPADEVWRNGQAVQWSTPIVDRQRDAEANDPPLVTLRRAVSLTLNDNGVTTTINTTLATIGQVLETQGVSLYLGDQVVPGLQERIKAGMTLKIHRSVPVEIKVDGQIIRTRTRATTVAGVLGQEGIGLVGKDKVEPALNEPIRPDMSIRVTRVREEFVVEFDPIPFETVWVPDPAVEIDNQRLVQEGQIGLTKRRYRVVYENDQEVDRFLEDTWAEQPPVTKTLAYGTKIIVRTLDTPDGPIEYWRKMRVYTTSYTAASSGKPRTHPRFGYTRLGWKATKGVVAVDPTVIPLRTKMYVPGYGLARAGDTGGAVKGKFVDLCFDEGAYQSWHWWTDIYLLTPVPNADQIRWVLPDWPRFPDRRR